MLYEYIEISILSYTMLFLPVLHNFLLKHYLLPQFTLIFQRKLCNTGGNSIVLEKNEISIYSYKEMP